MRATEILNIDWTSKRRRKIVASRNGTARNQLAEGYEEEDAEDNLLRSLVFQIYIFEIHRILDIYVISCLLHVVTK